ncbi:hypothetical protein OJAG_02820 [Oerskovia enterophila]|uniref:Uncharacterized protein n=1 Tax=Oerskovia enterophila TaxID=43678 RepID=A0A163T1J2_9CELL|nr:hypothetical protein OJAG_02820 [Oerskovia enterophila]
MGPVPVRPLELLAERSQGGVRVRERAVRPVQAQQGQVGVHGADQLGPREVLARREHLGRVGPARLAESRASPGQGPVPRSRERRDQARARVVRAQAAGRHDDARREPCGLRDDLPDAVARPRAQVALVRVRRGARGVGECRADRRPESRGLDVRGASAARRGRSEAERHGHVTPAGVTGDGHDLVRDVLGQRAQETVRARVQHARVDQRARRRPPDRGDQVPRLARGERAVGQCERFRDGEEKAHGAIVPGPRAVGGAGHTGSLSRGDHLARRTCSRDVRGAVGRPGGAGRTPSSRPRCATMFP